MDCAILNQMIIEPSIDDKARNDKRSIQMQREFERDQKMAVAQHRVVAQRSSLNVNLHSAEDALEATDTMTIKKSAEPKCIESSSRFMSLDSRPVGCRISAPATAFMAVNFLKKTSADSVPQNRRDFHETFSNLIKLGSNDKQERCAKSMVISKEEQLWQTEVKDMIWLELQANMADRTLEEQDKFLFAARKNINALLEEIKSYRFNRKFYRADSVISAKTVDSGVSSMTGSGDGSILSK